jgi:multisubunit Na+/H+ antiporter MnhB subunit
MWQPRAAYRWLAGTPSEGRWWAVTRPLFVALVLGCMVSLVTSGAVSLRRAGDGTLNALLVPATQIIALAVVCWRRPRISFSRVVELSFTGYGPWVLWVILFSTLWAFVPAVEAFSAGWRLIG